MSTSPLQFCLRAAALVSASVLVGSTVFVGTVSASAAPPARKKATAQSSPSPSPTSTTTSVVTAPSVVTTVSPTPVATTVTTAPSTFTALRRSDFTSFADWDLGGPSVLPNPGSSVTLVDTGYDGVAAARAAIPSGTGNKYARTLWGNTYGQSGALSFGEGDDFTYGMALYLPVGFHANMQNYFVPMRWDNYGTTNVSRGGLSMYADGSMRLFRERDGVEGQVNLLGDKTFRLSEGSWHWLEVRQKLSTTSGSAFNALFVDGVQVGSSTTANFYGQAVSAIRFGIVAIDAGRQTLPLDVMYDRAVLGTGYLGPRA